jgi:predicted nucleic acid-binding protein
LSAFETCNTTVQRDLYGTFENEARERLRGRDESDWPVLAAALGLACPLWSEDADFFGTGIAVWTTNRVEIFLKMDTEARSQTKTENR